MVSKLPRDDDNDDDVDANDHDGFGLDVDQDREEMGGLTENDDVVEEKISPGGGQLGGGLGGGGFQGVRILSSKRYQGILWRHVLAWPRRNAVPKATARGRQNGHRSPKRVGDAEPTGSGSAA